MALWCDKYRPNTLNKLDFNKEQAQQLKRMVNSNDFPHLMVYGPSGAGKKTRIHCILKELFGSSVDKLRIEHQMFTTPSNRKIEIKMVSSNYHIEVNPSDVGIYDRVVVQEVIKTMASSGALGSNSFKVVVIAEADKLTKDAQHSLRRTMEKYISSCRLILSAESSSRLIPPIKSRCLLVRVPLPTIDQVATVLEKVAKKELFNLDRDALEKVAKESGRNLRRALLMLETMKMSTGRDVSKIPQPHWLVFIKGIAKKMLQQQSVQRLEDVRGYFYELMAHLIPPEVIFRCLLTELLPSCDDKLKSNIIALAATCEHKLRIGNKPIYHLEAFAAHFLTSYKTFSDECISLDNDECLKFGM